MEAPDIMPKNKNKTVITYTLGELFCGAGGLALGAKNANLETQDHIYRFQHNWSSDYDKDACASFQKNICNDNECSIICEDVRKLDMNSLSPIDGFAYGFPCNDFSIVGEQKGFQGEFGPLYTYGVKLLNLFRPKFFLAENVGGLKSANSGKAFRRIIKDLKKSGNGYNITAHLYKAEEYAVPQRRHRVIIVGIDKTLNKQFFIPAPITKDHPVKVIEAIQTPPIDPNIANHEKTRQSKIVVERLKYIQPGQNAWNADIPTHLRLNVKTARLSHIYKRLHPDQPSYTITGSGGGGTHVYHWEENRALTNRERARLQTFPDDFVFLGSKESVRKQIGMAVPPLLSQQIFQAILKTLLDIPYEYVDPNIALD